VDNGREANFRDSNRRRKRVLVKKSVQRVSQALLSVSCIQCNMVGSFTFFRFWGPGQKLAPVLIFEWHFQKWTRSPEHADCTVEGSTDKAACDATAANLSGCDRLPSVRT
jgi:hypothetical protein